jgi:CRISPR-associated protein Cas1
MEHRALREAGFAVDIERLKALAHQFTPSIANAPDVTTLLTEEARLTKAALQAGRPGQWAMATSPAAKQRRPAPTPPTSFLDHGNYLAYGLAATATWVLGLPHGLGRAARQDPPRRAGVRRGRLWSKMPPSCRRHFCRP